MGKVIKPVYVLLLLALTDGDIIAKSKPPFFPERLAQLCARARAGAVAAQFFSLAST